MKFVSGTKLMAVPYQIKKFENFSEMTAWRWTKSVVSVSVFTVVFLKAERVVVLGLPIVLRNQRSEVLKNFKKLSENGRAMGACPMSQNALPITLTTGASCDRLRNFA